MLPWGWENSQPELWPDPTWWKPTMRLKLTEPGTKSQHVSLHKFLRLKLDWLFCIVLTTGMLSSAAAIDREFVISAKKIANFNEFSEIKKIRKNSYKNSLNARMGVAFQWNRIWCVSRFHVNKNIKKTYKGGLHFTVICYTNTA